MGNSLNFSLPIAEAAEGFPVSCPISQGVSVEVAYTAAVTVVALVN